MSAMDFVNGGVNTYLNAFDSMRQHWEREAEERAAMINEHNRRVEAHNEYRREVNYQNKLAKLNQFVLETYEALEKQQKMIVSLAVDSECKQLSSRECAAMNQKFFSVWVPHLHRLQRSELMIDASNSVYLKIKNRTVDALFNAVGKDELDKIFVNYKSQESVQPKIIDERVRKKFSEDESRRFPKLDAVASSDHARKIEERKVEIKRIQSEPHNDSIHRLKIEYNCVFNYHFDSQLNQLSSHLDRLLEYGEKKSKYIESLCAEVNNCCHVLNANVEFLHRNNDVLFTHHNKALERVWVVFYENFEIVEFQNYLMPYAKKHIDQNDSLWAFLSMENFDAMKLEAVKEKLKNGDPRPGIPRECFTLSYFAGSIDADDDISELAKQMADGATNPAAALPNRPVG